MFKINFAIEDNLRGQKLDLDNLDLSVLADFIKDVRIFLRGSKNQDLNNLKIGIESGSAVITVAGQESEFQGIIKDYRYLQSNTDLSHIDSKRSFIIKKWQDDEAVSKNKRLYKISQIETTTNTIKSQIEVSQKSTYELPQTWIEVEKYVHGQIQDMGGKKHANIHIDLENGKTLKVDAEKQLLANKPENHLYKNQLLRIKALQNIDTKELKDPELLSFEKHKPGFDKSKYANLAEKTAQAWQDVEDINEWVENNRGNFEEI